MRTLRSNRFVLIFLLSERIVDYYSNLWLVAWLPSGMQPYRIFTPFFATSSPHPACHTAYACPREALSA